MNAYVFAIMRALKGKLPASKRDEKSRPASTAPGRNKGNPNENQPEAGKKK